MAKAVINFKVDENLKSKFMKSYLNNRKENHTLMTENAFYEMIDKARSEKPIKLTADERKALYEMD